MRKIADEMGLEAIAQLRFGPGPAKNSCPPEGACGHSALILRDDLVDSIGAPRST